MKEVWKDIKGFEGRYMVSNLGDVYSLIYDKKLKPKIDKDGYLEFGLVDSNKKRHFKRCHRLVAESFIPNPNNYPIINHIDENKSNNIVSNLEWCDFKHNNNYGKRKEFHKKMKRDKKGRFVCAE